MAFLNFAKLSTKLLTDDIPTTAADSESFTVCAPESWKGSSLDHNQASFCAQAQDSKRSTVLK